jgi:transcription elongation factor Elf1
VSISREEKYDCYADKGEVPINTLLKDGWWWTCYGPKCGEQITQDTVDNEGARIITGVPYCARCIRENPILSEMKGIGMIDLATCQKCEKDWETEIEQMMSDNTVMEAEIGELREELTYSEVRKSELLREMQWLRQRLVASEATTSLPQSKLQVANGLVQRGDVATMCKVLDGFRDGDK